MKILVSDVDGTLVEDGTLKINPEYYEVVRKLTEKGIHVIIASGRQYASVRRLFEPVSDLISYIVEGGSMILERGKQVEVLHPIPRDMAREIIADARKLPDTDVMISVAEKAYAPLENTKMFQWLKNSYHFDLEALGGWDVLPEGEIGKISIYHPSDAEGVCSTWFTPKWKSKLNGCSAGSWWMDLVAADVSKASALKELCRRLEVDLKDVYAFGDNMNDIAMLEAAGKSFAVENGRVEVKAIADEVIPGYQKDGVLKVWKEILATL
ncbi:MAG: HAD family hydrolase [Lachnospiraceae bacterium]